MIATLLPAFRRHIRDDWSSTYWPKGWDLPAFKKGSLSFSLLSHAPPQPVITQEIDTIVCLVLGTASPASLVWEGWEYRRCPRPIGHTTQQPPGKNILTCPHTVKGMMGKGHHTESWGHNKNIMPSRQSGGSKNMPSSPSLVPTLPHIYLGISLSPVLFTSSIVHGHWGRLGLGMFLLGLTSTIAGRSHISTSVYIKCHPLLFSPLLGMPIQGCLGSPTIYNK